MSIPLLGPAWLPVAIALYGLALCILQHCVLRRVPSTDDSRWTVAGILGACFGALLAPDPWIGALLLTLALSVPLSLLRFPTHTTILAFPVDGATILLMASAWVVALGLLTAALRQSGSVTLFLVGLLALCAYTIVVGVLQVYRGLTCIVVTDALFYNQPIGTPVRVPTAFLHNSWKATALHALALPVACALSWPLGWQTPPLVLLIVGMLWHLWKAEGETCLAAAGVGLLAFGWASGLALPVLVVAPLSLVAYPGFRARVLSNPRWGAWRRGLDYWKRSGWLGAGVGAWPALHIMTPEEPGRVWKQAHNEYLETLVDAGPVPVLCTVGYLGTALWRAWGGLPPIEAGLFGSLIGLAVLSVGYMPWRSWPINLYALGLLACWEALR